MIQDVINKIKKFKDLGTHSNWLYDFLDEIIKDLDYESNQLGKPVMQKIADVFGEVKVIYNRENRNNYKDSYKKPFVLYENLNATLKKIDMEFQRNTGDKPKGRHYQIIITVSNFSA